MDELEFYNGQLTGEEIDKRVIRVLNVSISAGATTTTISDANITDKHVVVYVYMDLPSAQVDEWIYDTAAGSLTITGTCRGTVNLAITLAIPL